MEERVAEGNTQSSEASEQSTISTIEGELEFETDSQASSAAPTETTPGLESGDDLESGPTSTPPHLPRLIMATARPTLEVGGVKLTLNAAPTTDLRQLAVYKKDKRASLSEEKRAEHFRYATAKQQTDRFTQLPLSVMGEDDLQDTYNLQMCLDEAQENMARYDMLDVFTILKIENGSATGELGDLFKNYVTIDIDDVAKSCKFYATMVDATVNPWIQENLSLTADYLKNNTEPETYRKCLETYNQYEMEERGGPVLFAILMRQLQSNSITVVMALRDKLTKLSLKDYPGEDVSKLVSHVRGILKRLHSIERTDTTGTVVDSKVPEDLGKTLLTVFQTSSDENFNALFKMKYLTGFQQSLTLGEKGFGKPETILKEAESYYAAISSSTDGWTGDVQKGHETAFKAAALNATGERPCFNCGTPGHDFNTCTKPKNEARIKANKKHFFDTVRSNRNTSGRSGGRGRGRGRGTGGRGRGRGGRSDFAHPKPGEDTHRTIKGKKYYFSPPDKRWLLDQSANVATGTPNAVDTPSDGHAPPATPPPVPASIPIPAASVAGSTLTGTVSNPERVKAAVQLASVNATRQLSATMAGFADAIQQSLE